MHTCKLKYKQDEITILISIIIDNHVSNQHYYHEKHHNGNFGNISLIML